MVYQFVVLAALVAAARAGILTGGATLGYSTPLVAAPIARTVAAEPYDPNPQYQFGYDVQDPLTGDSHGQVESRSGDVVTGSYNLLEADGSRRVVEYSADPVNGFNAVVSRQGGVAAPALARVAPVAAPVLRSAAVAPWAGASVAPWAGASVVPSGLTTASWPGASVFRSAPVW